MDHEFEIAVSFAGEDRAYVEAFVKACKSLGLKVLYDKDMKVKWWGKDFVREQRIVYGEKARYFMPFISEHYLAKPIPRDEFTAALARSVDEFGDYFLPVKLGAVTIPRDMIPPTIHYIEVRTETPRELAEMAFLRIRGMTPEEYAPLQPAVSLHFPMPQSKLPVRASVEFNPLRAGRAMLAGLVDELSVRFAGLEPAGYLTDRIERDGVVGFRISVKGEQVFALDLWQGAMLSESSLGFRYGTGNSYMMDRTSSNAVGTPIYDRRAGCVKLDITNFSLLRTGDIQQQLTQSELLEAIWDRVVDSLNQHR